MSAAKIINTLWPLVDGNKLTDEQLKRLCCAEDLDTTMRNAADVLTGIGCLVAVDEIGAGNFQERDSVTRLLCFFSDFIDSAAATYRVRAEKIVPYEKSANHEGITKWLNPRKAKPGGLPEAIGLRLMIPANQMEITK